MWGVEWQNVDFGTGLLPNIKIWGKNDDTGQYHPTNGIFSTTIHELAHTTHIREMNWGTIDYGQVSKIIYESWADAVEWFITRIEYVDRGEDDYDDPTVEVYRVLNADNKQWWDRNRSHDYTPLFIDLVDDYNQAVAFESNNPPNINKPDEEITGYTLAGIESTILKHSYSLFYLNSALLNYRPTTVTPQEINDYMLFYNNL